MPRFNQAKQDMLHEYLLLCAQQLDEEDVEEVSLDSLMAEGDARRALEEAQYNE